jgi:hypothetical protein
MFPTEPAAPVPESSGEAEPTQPLMDDLPYFMTLKQAAYVLDGETPASISRLVKRSLLRGVRVGRTRFVLTDSVRELRAVRKARGAAWR